MFEFGGKRVTHGAIADSGYQYPYIKLVLGSEKTAD